MRRPKRDPKALEKTLQLLQVKRHLTAKIAAKHLGISTSVASARLATLARVGKADRISRGSYTLHPVGHGAIIPVEGSLEAMIARLEAKQIIVENQLKVLRAALAIKIEQEGGQ